MSGVELEAGETSLTLTLGIAASVEVKLPRAVDSSSARARFCKKTHQLKVTLTLLQHP